AERAGPPKLELERLRRHGGNALRDHLDVRQLDRPDEPGSQVEVGRGDPSETRSRLRARRDVGGELGPVPLGQRQAEEGANFQRAGFAQCDGAHAAGALGRQPKLELTESIPPAMLSSWIMLTSSGVAIGLDDSTSITAVAGIRSGTGTFSFGFLTPRAWRNQSNIVS